MARSLEMRHWRVLARHGQDGPAVDVASNVIENVMESRLRHAAPIASVAQVRFDKAVKRALSKM